MRLSEVKKVLSSLQKVSFKLADGTMVPAHFHITEVGVVTKHFIDCGGTVRTEKKANFQLWSADDLDHRLAPTKLMDIIQLSEKVLGLGDLEVEVEYQNSTIGKYNLSFDGYDFILLNTQTACLALDSCGIQSEKPKINLSSLPVTNSCTPGGGCC
jgi:hypothetical protein